MGRRGSGRSVWCTDRGLAGAADDFSDPDNVAFYGLLSEANLRCAYTGDALQIALDAIVVGERGPVATGDTVDLPYFVAVTAPDRSILSKRPFAPRIAFEGGQKRAGVTDHIEETIPLGGRKGSDLIVVLGFQQSPEVVEFYKRFYGRTAEIPSLAAPEAPLGAPGGEVIRLERPKGNGRSEHCIGNDVLVYFRYPSAHEHCACT